jgi:hypothetical protein
MNLRSSLSKEHTKALTLRIGNYIGKNRGRYKEVVDLVINGDSVIAQRASWVLGVHGEKHPELILPFLSRLVPLLGKPVHAAIKRNILRVLQYVSIPDKYESATVNHCFDLLSASDESIAVKAFSITVIVNLSKKYPDLLQELKGWCDNNIDVMSKAEISRLKRSGILAGKKSDQSKII